MKASCQCLTAVFVLLAFALPVGGAKPVLDAPPANAQKPYSPAIDQRVGVTPPPFIWVPSGRKATYALQLSRSKDFPPDQTRGYHKISTSVYVPSEPLPAGAWFWRYGVETGRGTVFGKARAFTVSKDARKFPFPDFKALIAKVPKRHPRVLFAGKHLQRIRHAARGELKRDIDRLVASARRAIGRQLVAEPPRPKSGSQRVTVMRTTRPPMDHMEQCALAYLLTGDKPLGLEAKRRIMHFFSWDPNGPTGLWGYDEPAMWMMMRGMRAYDWTHELFTPAERAKVEPVMKVRARQFYIHLKDKRRFETNPYESHAGRMPGFLGEAALCFAHEWPEARGWLEYATLLYMTSYPAWGGDDGGWQEGPGYWSAYMSFALHYVVALRNATGVDLMNKPFFRNTPYYALYTAPPYHEHRPFGDGAWSSPAGIGRVLYAFSSLLDDPYLRWFHQASGRSRGRDLLTLMTYAPGVKPKVPSDLPPARVFPAVGLASMHTALGEKDKDIALLFRSSPFGSVSHGHADQNAFTVDAFGRSLALATGFYPWYSSPHHHQWTRDTRSVCSVLVDGKGQVVRSWKARGRIVAFKSTRGYDYVAGEAADAYGGRLKRFRRQIVHVRPGVFVIYDDLVAAKPSTFQWLLHAHDRIGVEGRVLRVRRDPAAMDVHMLLPQQSTVSQDDKYMPEPESHKYKRRKYEKTWHLAVSTKQPESAGRFLNVLVVRRRSDEHPVSKVSLVRTKGQLGVNMVRRDGKVDTVLFRTAQSGDNPVRVLLGGLDEK
ncbi:MAG: DUF4962 domain-containing protein [Phycisphaerae bacterium]|nr:DUF4962 domain-containing protein [Phycisphaerae bacterium]